MVDLSWKPDWERARERICTWWERRGIVLDVLAPRERPLETLKTLEAVERNEEEGSFFGWAIFHGFSSGPLGASPLKSCPRLFMAR